MNAVRRWRAYARQYGLAGLVRYLFTRTVRPVWESSSAEILVLEPPVPDRQAKVRLEIHELDRAEALKAELLQPDWDRRWSQGDRCYGAWVGGVCVHHSWVTTGEARIGELHGRLAIGPDEAYIYDCYTSDSCRGQGIFPAVLSQIGREYTARGAARLWIAVEHENRSSMKAIERAGFTRAGSVNYRRFGKTVRVEVTREQGKPQIGFTAEGAG